MNRATPYLAKFSRFVALACALLAVTAQASAASAEERFTQAVAAYQNGDFGAAHDQFHALALESAKPALYFNAGNAAFSAGQMPDAALRYREALELDPGYAPARQNLALTEERAKAVTSPVGTSMWNKSATGSFVDRLASIAPGVSLDTLVILTSLFGWAAAIAAAVLFTRILRRRSGKVAPALTAAACLAVACACGLMSFQRWKLHSTTRPAVVMVATTAYSEPSEATAKLADLPPASSILVLDSRGDWLYATLPTGTNAWLRGTSIQQVPRRAEMASKKS